MKPESSQPTIYAKAQTCLYSFQEFQRIAALHYPEQAPVLSQLFKDLSNWRYFAEARATGSHGIDHFLRKQPDLVILIVRLLQLLDDRCMLLVYCSPACALYSNALLGC